MGRSHQQSLMVLTAFILVTVLVVVADKQSGNVASCCQRFSTEIQQKMFCRVQGYVPTVTCGNNRQAVLFFINSQIRRCADPREAWVKKLQEFIDKKRKCMSRKKASTGKRVGSPSGGSRSKPGNHLTSKAATRILPSTTALPNMAINPTEPSTTALLNMAINPPELSTTALPNMAVYPTVPSTTALPIMAISSTEPTIAGLPNVAVNSTEPTIAGLPNMLVNPPELPTTAHPNMDVNRTAPSITALPNMIVNTPELSTTALLNMAINSTETTITGLPNMAINSTEPTIAALPNMAVNPPEPSTTALPNMAVHSTKDPYPTIFPNMDDPPSMALPKMADHSTDPYTSNLPNMAIKSTDPFTAAHKNTAVHSTNSPTSALHSRNDPRAIVLPNISGHSTDNPSTTVLPKMAACTTHGPSPKTQKEKGNLGRIPKAVAGSRDAQLAAAAPQRTGPSLGHSDGERGSHPDAPTPEPMKERGAPVATGTSRDVVIVATLTIGGLILAILGYFFYKARRKEPPSPRDTGVEILPLAPHQGSPRDAVDTERELAPESIALV